MKRPILMAALLALPSAAFAQDANAKPLQRVALDTLKPVAVGQETAKARPFLGITIGESKAGAVHIGSVYDETGAKSAGLKAGDRIVRVGERKTTNADELIQAVREHKIGDQVAVVVDRKGKEKLFLVSLGKRPAEAGGHVTEVAPKAKHTGGSLEDVTNATPQRGEKWVTETQEGIERHVQEIHSHDEHGEHAEHGHMQKAEKSKGSFWFGKAKGQDHFEAEVENHHHGDEHAEKKEGTWLKVFGPKGAEGKGERFLLGEADVLEGLDVELGDLGVDLEQLLEEARSGAVRKGMHIFEMGTGSDGAHGHGEVHQHILETLHEHLPETLELEGEVRVMISGPNGTQHQIFHMGGDRYGHAKAKSSKGKFFGRKGGKAQKAQSGACDSCSCDCKADQASLFQKKSKGAPSKFLFRSESGKDMGLNEGEAEAHIVWLNSSEKREQGKAKQAKAKAKAKQAKAKAKKAKQQRAKQAEARAKQAESRAEQAMKREWAAKQRSERRMRGEQSELVELRAELREMREQLTELRATLDAMRRHRSER